MAQKISKKQKKQRKQLVSSDNVYQEFAGVYDMLSADEHSLKMIPYTQRIFRKFRFSGSTGLDLCCGTGSATLSLGECGYSMIGVDGAKMMLKKARAKALRQEISTKFLHGVLNVRQSFGVLDRDAPGFEGIFQER